MDESEVRQLFGYNVKRLRKMQKISQMQLAERVNMAFTFISDIENGKKWVSPETIAKLSTALGVESYHFFLPVDYVGGKDSNVSAFIAELKEIITKLESRYIGG